MGLFDKLLGGDSLSSTEREVIESLTQSRVSFADLYPVLEWREEDDIYVCKEGLGFILDLTIPPYLSEEDESVFEALITYAHPNDTIVGFWTFADPNIKPFMDYWKSLHSYRPYVKNPSLVRKIVEERYNFYLKASREGFWTGAKPRIFRNWVWVLYPFSKDPFAQIEEIKKHRTRIEGVLRRYIPRSVSAGELITVLRSLLSPSHSGVVNADHRDINTQVWPGDLVMRVEREEGEVADLCFSDGREKRYWRGFHVNTFPYQISLWEFQNIFFPYQSHDLSTFLSDPFMFALVVRIKDPGRRKEAIRTKAMYKIHSAERNPLIKFFPSIAEKAQEAQYVLKLIEDGKLPYSASLFFFLSAPSREDLELSSSEFLTRLQERNFDVTREIDVSLVNSFIECLPLGSIRARNDLFMRYSTLFSSSIASLVPFVGQVPSSPEPINLYVDRKYGLFGFNRFHSKTNYNKITVAESGGGKSFSQGDDQILSLASGALVRVIDKGRSYESLCRLIGGEFIDFHEGEDICLNPFTTALSSGGELIDEEYVLLTSILGVLAGYDLSEQDIVGEGERGRVASWFIQAVQKAWERKGNSAGVSDVYDALMEMGEEEPKKLAQALHPFAYGPYSRYFNGPATVRYSSDYVVLELEGLGGKDVRLQTAVLTTLIATVLREFMLSFREEEKENRVRNKILYVDEAWDLFRKGGIANFLELAVRTFRKYRASLEVISQAYQDFMKGDAQRAIASNSAHLFCLYPKKSDVIKAHREGALPLSDFEVELLGSLTTVPGKFSEFYLSSSFFSGVGRLIVDRFSYWVFTTSGQERGRRSAIAGRIGVQRALELLSGQFPILEILLERKLLTSDQYFALLYLLSTSRFRGMEGGELAVRLGMIREEDLERIKEELRALADGKMA